MKARLDLGINTIFLCKKIETIIIDGQTIHRRDLFEPTVSVLGQSTQKRLSVKIQDFYKYIQKNKEKITHIFYSDLPDVDMTWFYFDDYNKMPKTLHNLEGPAIKTNKGTSSKTPIVNSYYIDGERLTQEEWFNHPKRKQYLRESKLERILNEQTEIYTCQS